MTETTIDSKGRIVIPEEIRRELKLGEGSKLRVTVSHGDSSIVIRPSRDPEGFMALEGILKEGSAAKVADPLRLKEIWTPT